MERTVNPTMANTIAQAVAACLTKTDEATKYVDADIKRHEDRLVRARQRMKDCKGPLDEKLRLCNEVDKHKEALRMKRLSRWDDIDALRAELKNQN